MSNKAFLDDAKTKQEGNLEELTFSTILTETSRPKAIVSKIMSRRIGMKYVSNNWSVLKKQHFTSHFIKLNEKLCFTLGIIVLIICCKIKIIPLTNKTVLYEFKLFETQFILFLTYKVNLKKFLTRCDYDRWGKNLASFWFRIKLFFTLFCSLDIQKYLSKEIFGISKREREIAILVEQCLWWVHTST